MELVYTGYHAYPAWVKYSNPGAVFRAVLKDLCRFKSCIKYKLKYVTLSARLVVWMGVEADDFNVTRDALLSQSCR